jgi:hypothetical protein
LWFRARAANGYRTVTRTNIGCQRPTTSRPWKRPGPVRGGAGLSGKLLLTIPLVMIAGLLIYVPAIANFRMNRLNDRLAAANTAALVLAAAPSAWCRTRWRGRS